MTKVGSCIENLRGPEISCNGRENKRTGRKAKLLGEMCQPLTPCQHDPTAACGTFPPFLSSFWFLQPEGADQFGLAQSYPCLEWIGFTKFPSKEPLESIHLWISLVRIRNSPTKLNLELKRDFHLANVRCASGAAGDSLPLSRNRGLTPSGIMNFSSLAPKELAQWADVRTPLATSQMQTIERWPTSTEESLWSHGYCFGGPKMH